MILVFALDFALLAKPSGSPIANKISMLLKTVHPPDSIICQILFHMVPSLAILPTISGLFNTVASATTIPKKQK